jgi:hypothetical protein
VVSRSIPKSWERSMFGLGALALDRDRLRRHYALEKRDRSRSIASAFQHPTSDPKTVS